MTDNTKQPDTTDSTPSNKAAKPQTMSKTIKGQKYFAPEGRHSQQSHRLARERAAAQGHATIQEEHAHNRTMVKAELSRIAALKATQKPNPPK